MSEPNDLDRLCGEIATQLQTYQARKEFSMSLAVQLCDIDTENVLKTAGRIYEWLYGEETT